MYRRSESGLGKVTPCMCGSRSEGRPFLPLKLTDDPAKHVLRSELFREGASTQRFAPVMAGKGSSGTVCPPRLGSCSAVAAEQRGRFTRCGRIKGFKQGRPARPSKLRTGRKSNRDEGVSATNNWKAMVRKSFEFDLPLLDGAGMARRAWQPPLRYSR